MATFKIDPSAVRGIANGLENIGTFLEGVDKQLGECMDLLNSNYFVGKVGGAALKRHISLLKPRVIKTAKGCTELSAEVKAAVDAYEKGDQLGSTRFYR